MSRTGQLDEAGVRLALFGASPDTGNLGVSALYESICAGVRRSLPQANLTVFDHGLGTRAGIAADDDGAPFAIERRGARAGHRYLRPENLLTMAMAARLNGTGARLNGNIRAIDRCRAVLDISGGDSFSDLYGAKRFWSVARPKLIALRRGVPLILLPQTYGPFEDPKLRAIAAHIVRGAAQCWARDPRSYGALRELAGAQFDPQRHRCGVDVAFGLPATPCQEALEPRLLAMIDADRAERPLIGLNVSGLIYNDPESARKQYRLKADYRRAVDALLQWLLTVTPANIVLVPHVRAPVGHYESDLTACGAVADSVGAAFRPRVCIAPDTLAAREVKWLIAQTDWFCGTRMHSTIAALSSGVPTATVSYSDKALGVFETCEQDGHVIDPREFDTQTVVSKLTHRYGQKDAAGVTLANQLIEVKRSAAAQWQAIANAISLRSAPQMRRAAAPQPAG